MEPTRRTALFQSLALAVLNGQVPDDENPDRRLPIPPNPEEDRKLPNGKSQKDAIAKQEHEEVMKDVNSLVQEAEQLRTELKNAGDYVVPLASVKKTEDIERLARRIRGHLRY